MRRHRVALGAVLAAAALAGSGADVRLAAQTVPHRRALLIGVTKFVTQGIKVHPLDGPENDVTLFAQALRERLNVTEIRTLAGLPANKDDWPTRENIHREFAALTKSGPNDQIVILMAGHGSQQPANDDPDDVEYDGLDEIFLPADIGAWDGSKGAVTNAIVDDDIRQWITDIRRTGASVWVIFDACHSGTMTRGLPQDVERERQVPMESLGIPPKAIDDARARGARAPRRPSSKTMLGLPDSAGEIAAMYAANSDEKTIEKRFEPGDSPFRGIFTYTITQILNEVTSPITYAELAQRVLDRYRARQYFSATPTFEGGALDREILGQRTWPDRPRITLSRADTGWTVDAGTILNLVPGTVLEVFPPAGTANADRAVGHVKVLTAQATSATVAPSAFGKVPAPATQSLQPGSRARVVYYGMGEMRLGVALQRTVAAMTSGGEPTYDVVRRGTGPPAVERALDNLMKDTNGLAEHVDSAAQADWFVRVAGSDLVLIPASGWQPGSAPAIDCDPQTGGLRTPTPIRHYAIDDVNAASLGANLTAAIRRAARVANLSRLATMPGSGVEFELSVKRFDRATGGVGRSLLSPPLKDPVVRDGEYVEYIVRNSGSISIDLTLLYIDASFRITSIFPRREAQADIRVPPGGVRTHRELITGCPLGWESTVAIAVEGEGAFRNFSALEQEGFTRGLNDQDSPLRRVLEGAAFGRGAATRGPIEEQALDHFAVKVAAWRTEGKR